MNGKQPQLRVLIIEDDAEARANLCDILELDNFLLDQADSAAAALERSDWSEVGAIILDRRLPDAKADELLPRLKQLAPDAAIIVVTGYADLQDAILALRQGATDYILKPIEPDGLRARLRRVAEYRQTQQELLRAQRRFRLMVQNAADVIATLDADGTVLSLNPAVERVLGYKPEDRVGRNVLTDATEDPETLIACRRLLAEARGRDSPVVGELRMRHADGSLRHIEAVVQDQLDDPSMRAIVVNYRDITERRHAEERAMQSERLAAIGRMVTGLAHESRNALQRSQACLEMLRLRVRTDPEALALIGRMQQAQDDLHHLYEDVRAFAAPIRLDLQKTDLSTAWRGAWSQLESLWRTRDAVLVDETAGADLHCAFDLFRIERVFCNLFENALAACDDPVRISLTAQLTSTEITIFVRDNGPGIKLELRERVFEPFYTTKTKGTGLGMAIARRIVEAHGGRIAVSPEGPGAKIVLTLPRGE